MPINNALTPQGQNALGAAFGYYPQLRRNRRNQDPQAALDMPVQFLRGRLASTLGMPSDVLNTFQSPLPMEVYGDVDYSAAQQVPYGTQDLLQQLPLAPTGPAQQAAANLGSVVPLTPMEALQAARLARQAALAGGQAVASTGRALAPVAGDMLTNYMVKRNMILPLDVYHGTPHTLPPTARNPLGEFDASKIGTGEGAQAYGHGIYTAEAKDVAQNYRNVLAGKDGSALGHAAHIVNVYGGDYEKALKHLKSIQPALNETTFTGESHELIRDAIKAIENGAYKLADKGNLYKVDLPDEMIAKMLDYDKPLSKQDPAVRKMITESFPGGYINGVYIDPVKSQLTGKALLDQLSMIANKRNEPGFRSAETALRQAGIPGIKYLDATSRDAGKGTRNFVTFPGEEKNMTILERNGQGLTPALLPQQLALELAQQRAALPVSKGGLGLPADNTAQQRAAAMRFQERGFHETSGKNIEDGLLKFDVKRAGAAVSDEQTPYAMFIKPHGENIGVARENPVQMPLMVKSNLTDENIISSFADREELQQYLNQFPDIRSATKAVSDLDKKMANYMDEVMRKVDVLDGQGKTEEATKLLNSINSNSNLMRAFDAKTNELAAISKQKITDLFKSKNIGTVHLSNDAGNFGRKTITEMVLNPAENVRSRFAAFDPFRRTAATAALMGVAAPDLLAAQSGRGSDNEMRKFMRQGR